MRYILVLLVSVSAMAADIEQSVSTVSGNPVTFRLKDFNSGRGEMAVSGHIWRLRHYWVGKLSNSNRDYLDINSANGIVLSTTSAAQTTPPSGFQTWNGAQVIALINVRTNADLDVAPQHGTLQYSATSSGEPFDGPEVVYTPTQQYVGSDSFLVTYRLLNVTTDTVASLLVNITVTNTAPTISLSASPSTALIGTEVALPAVTADANGHAISVSYDYGDGSTGNAASHTYSAAGVYTVTATASDGFGGTSTASTIVTIVGNENTPTARFTTSDVVAFVGVPFVLDGITSTDPQNAIESYTWDFGDGTPLGSKPTLSHIYLQTGTVTIRFTVTDSEGLSSTLTRDVEVLPAEAAATFDAEVRVTTTYFPQKQGRDTVSVFARVNIGDTQLVTGSLVALEYAGKRFTATLDKRGKGSGWTVKQNLRRQAPGTVEVALKARNVDIAALLETAGAIDDGTVDIPFRLELGPKTILVDVPTDFDVSAARGKGAGEVD